LKYLVAKYQLLSTAKPKILFETAQVNLGLFLYKNLNLYQKEF